MSPRRNEKEKDTGRSQKGFERGKSRGPGTQHGVDRRPHEGGSKQQDGEQGDE